MTPDRAEFWRLARAWLSGAEWWPDGDRLFNFLVAARPAWTHHSVITVMLRAWARVAEHQHRGRRTT